MNASKPQILHDAHTLRLTAISPQQRGGKHVNSVRTLFAPPTPLESRKKGKPSAEGCREAPSERSSWLHKRTPRFSARSNRICTALRGADEPGAGVTEHVKHLVSTPMRFAD